MKKILTLGIVLLTVNSLLPAQEITFLRNQIQLGNHPGTRRECQP